LAPDECHKANYSGAEDYHVYLPEPAVDFPLVGAWVGTPDRILRNGLWLNPKVLPMRLPRLRLSLRWMMSAVALISLSLAYVLPECQRLFWLYGHPASVKNFSASILCKPVPGEASHATRSLPTYSIGRPFRMQVTSTSTPAPWLPAGLTFRVNVVVKITDPTTFTTVYETQRKSRHVRSGPVASGGEQETAVFELTPRRAGYYAVRYEQEVVDFFGRTSTAATATTFFNAR
jgi:hypothetical protein